MSFLSFRKIVGFASIVTGATLLVPYFISSQVVAPSPAASLTPASVSVDLAPNGSPVDLTATLTNVGGGLLTWRVGTIRDVSAGSAPAVSAGPVATARIYDKSNIDRMAYVAGEIIVGVKETMGASPGLRMAAPLSFGGGKYKVKREMVRAHRGSRAASGARRSSAPVLRPGRKLYLVTADDKSKAGMQSAIDELRKDPNVVYAEPNYILKAIGIPNDPDFNMLYGMHNSGQNGGTVDADIDAPEAWDTYTGDRNIVVGIIDTGIDYLHPDLVDNIWTNPGEIPGNGIDDDGNGYIDDVHGYDFANNDSDPMDDHFHGTHVAGTIAASGNNGLGVVGVAWKAKLAALKFLDASGSGSLDAAVEAIAYANAMDIPITSNSWGGGGFSQALKDVIDAGGERGFLFVAAAGNAASDNDQFPSYPASYTSENIISVAATDNRDELASFSNFGATTVDLGAPGVDIYSCAPGGGYRFLSGTSMATPHVSGAAALLKSFNPDLGYVELKAALLSNVDPITSLNGRVVSNGRLNLAKALAGTSPPWISMIPRGPGELAAGAKQVLTARVDPKGLTAGEHRALVQIATNDPAVPDRELEVIARISACRSLSLSPSALDFGPVWRGSSRHLTLTLNNSCNDFTQVLSISSTHPTFTVTDKLPIRVAPFGKATVDVLYTPDDLVADAGVLTLNSDAQDNPTLKVDLRGTGIVPPTVSVDPARFELTVDPAEQAIRKMIVKNTGGDVLNLKLSISSKTAPKSTGLGQLIPGKSILGGGAAGKTYASGKGQSLSPNLHPAFAATASDLKVLYLTTLLSTGEEDGLVAGLRALPNVGSLDVLNGGIATPDLAYLQNYDLVIVSANRGWSDPFLLGNTLADYVDNGGGVCLMVASIASGGGYSLAGRIIEPQYLPMQMAGPGNGGEATEFVSHPITEGVHSIFCLLPTASTEIQGDGIALGHYPDGALIGAVNPNKSVVAINVFPQDGFWNGDLILMMGNTLEYLAGGAGWLKVDPKKASIAPGGSMEFTLSINAEKQLAGDQESNVEIVHNDPNGTNPLRVPVLIHVKPVSHLALATSKYDFGGTLVGGQSATTVILTNSGNQDTKVSRIDIAKPFSSNAILPLIVPAFSKATVALMFEPKKEGYVAGGATFSSNAVDHPTLSLTLRGQGLPAPMAVLSPENLTVNLAYSAPPKDLTSTLSNRGKGVLQYSIGSPKDITPAPSTPAPKPVVKERLFQTENYDRPAVAGELLVGLNEGQSVFANVSALSATGITVKRTVIRAVAPKGKSAFNIGRKIILVSVADTTRAGILRAVEALRKDANVAYAEPNYRLKAIGIPNDPDFNLLYGMNNTGTNGGKADADIDAPEAWDTYTGDHNVIVGIIDTGIDYFHPDLVDNIWTNPGEIPGNGIDDDGNGYIDDVHGYDFANNDSDPMDDHYHGTHVAGTIAASGNNGVGVVGVAWKAKLAALKFLDSFGSGTLDAAVEAIAYANAMEIPITSNSWGGGGFSQALKDVIDAGGDRGYLFVAAAGNDFSDNDIFPSYPASYESDNIISVAATDSRDAMAYFSNFGATSVDLGAPGVNIYSCAPGGQYQYLSGTSMATPHVSGAAALLKSFNPQLSYLELKATLLSSVDSIPSLNGKVLSNGRLNLAKALGSVTPPWVSIRPRGNGELASGASLPLTVTVNPKGLIAGTHNAVVKITTNDPKAPSKELQVKAMVSGCRSLTVSPATLDFGSVWMGAKKHLSLTLNNTCNDWTELSSITLSHKAFVVTAVLPLRIAPFGMTTLDIVYTPDDLLADKALITLKSNAQDNPILKVNALGIGVQPPSISVSPAKIVETMDPSEQKTTLLGVTNKGGADLVVSLQTTFEKKAVPGPNPKVTTFQKKTGMRYASRSGGLMPKSIHPLLRSSGVGLKVLYLTTLTLADSTGDEFMQGLRGLSQVVQLDYLDGSMAVPNVDYLQAYDVILVSANNPWADALATGDALADYVDAGGRVVLLVAAIANGGGYELQGRIATPDYLPLVKAGPGSGGVATVFANHPITLGLTSVECSLPTATTMIQGAGLSLGSYDSQALLGAVNQSKPVVAINVFPEDGYWAGDVILMIANTLDYLHSMNSWVKVDPANLIVPAGSTKQVKLNFDTEKMDAGAYAAMLNLAHNAPLGANPLQVPVNLTVNAKNCLEASTALVDFGKIWTDRSSSSKITLTNPCNRPTKVNALTVSPKVFSTSVLVPLDVPPFSSVDVELTYRPDDLNPDVGSFLIKSDAKDHPSISIALKGTGIKPPAISISPSSLSLTMDPGATAQKSISILNSGGDSLRVKVQLKSLDNAVKSGEAPKLTAGKAATVRPLIGVSGASLSHISARNFKSMAGGSLKVLFAHALGMAPEGNDFTRALSELENVASVDILDVQFQTPNLAYLQDYDIVMVATDFPPADNVGLGNVLADYVDAGGKVVLAGGAFYAEEPWALGGRIATPEYMPIAKGYTSYGGYSKNLVNHPINAGVVSIYAGIDIAADSTQGEGLPLGNYETGSLTGAYHASKAVVALNFYPIEGYWGGDIALMMGNTFDFLGQGIRWMKPALTDLVVAPGKSVALAVNFNSSQLAAGKFQGLLRLKHNAPVGVSPLDVPVTLQVRSKRCLSAEPTALDFGKVWKGQSAALALHLINKCNEPTKVTGYRTVDGSFSISNPVPFTVNAYSTFDVEAKFTAKDVKIHSSKLEILSDAKDNPILGVAVKGTGIMPPSIAVTPASLVETGKAGEIKKSVITVTNKGGDVLKVQINPSVNADGKTASGGGVPALIKSGVKPSVAPYFNGGAVASFQHLDTIPSPKPSGFKVLYVNTILPDSGFEDFFVHSLRGLPNVAQLSVLNSEFVTPNVDYLMGFDQVIVASSFSFADPVALGDALADYVDRGGHLCVMTAAISNFKGLGLEGRIATDQYMPMTMEGPGRAGMATTFENHPITAGVHVLFSRAPTSSNHVQGDGRPLGFFDSGVLIGAWNATKPVVAVNVFPMDGQWKGDLVPMMGNIFEYLSKSGTWLSAEPRSLSVAPGSSATAIISLDAGNIHAGIHTGQLTLSHNVPAQAPVLIPVKFTVDGHLALDVSSKVLDFGKVLIGNSQELALKLYNSGNLPVTVTSAITGNTDYFLGFNPFPLNLEPGDAVDLDVIFAPTLPSSAPAQLEFRTDGLPPVLVSLNGIGQRPAMLSASTSPSPLNFSVALGGQSSGRLNLANLGDENLWYGMQLHFDTDSTKPTLQSAPTYGPEHFIPLLKGAADLRVGCPIDLTSGGPDMYGYRWFDSREMGGPIFSWTDISTSGRRLDLVSACDDCSEQVTLSFPFPFYGDNVSLLNVNANGFLTFGNAQESFSNQPIPSKTMPGNLVAALFEDLYPAGGGAIYFQDFGDKAVVQYKSVPDYRGTGRFDFEIILLADGTIDFQYQRLTGVKNTATVGIQNATGEDGLQVVYNADYLRNSLAVRIRTWLGVAQQVGGLAGSASKSLNLSIDSRGMPAGTYQGTLSVSGGGSTSTQAVDFPIKLIVAPTRGK